MRTSNARRAGIGFASFAAMTSAAILTAPSASAVVQSIAVSSQSPTAGCTYTITAHVDLLSSPFGNVVHFSDNGTELSGSPVSPNLAGVASISWTPSSAGSHDLQAKQLITTKDTTVNVTSSPVSGISSLGCLAGGLTGLSSSGDPATGSSGILSGLGS